MFKPVNYKREEFKKRLILFFLESPYNIGNNVDKTKNKTKMSIISDPVMLLRHLQENPIITETHEVRPRLHDGKQNSFFFCVFERFHLHTTALSKRSAFHRSAPDTPGEHTFMRQHSYTSKQITL